MDTTTPNPRRRRRPGEAGPRRAYTVRLDGDQVAALEALSAARDEPPTTTAAALLVGALGTAPGDPADELRALAMAMSATLDRLDRLEHLGLLTARAAVRGGVASRRLLALSASAEESRAMAAADQVLEAAGVPLT